VLRGPRARAKNCISHGPGGGNAAWAPELSGRGFSAVPPGVVEKRASVHWEDRAARAGARRPGARRLLAVVWEVEASQDAPLRDR
jgi:hypothetical protein